jgi:hypothetical protein
MEELGPIGRWVMAKPRPVRLAIIFLGYLIGFALLTLPIWRRITW